MRRAGVRSNDPIAQEAADEHLADGGTAIAAALTGFFTAAGAHSGVLLSPVTVLLGGAGVGMRCFDGRLRQPGRGTKRPRGFKAGEVVPDAARVGIAAGVAALLVAHAYDGGEGLARILKPGLRAAERAGADGRVALLRRIRGVGAGALTEPAFVRAFLRGAGPSEGGLVTPADFVALGDIDAAATERKVGRRKVYEAPWAAGGAGASASGVGYAVVAIDARGVAAAVCYRRDLDGFPVEDLDVDAHLGAEPVQRGVTRIAPGEARPAPAPVAIEKTASSLRVLAWPALAAVGASDFDAPTLSVEFDVRTREVTLVG